MSAGDPPIRNLRRSIVLGVSAMLVKKLTLLFRKGLSPVLVGLLCGLGALGAAPQPGAKPSTSPWDIETSYLFNRPEFTWGRNPFESKPGFGPALETEPRYELTAVFYDGTDSEAIINGQVLRVGDEIGWRIVDTIGPNYALLTDGRDSLIELNLPIPRGAASSIQLEEVKGKP
jgi:hypothetical protein